jgi:hypothetical protein
VSGNRMHAPVPVLESIRYLWMGKGGDGSTVEHRLPQTGRNVSRCAQIPPHACLHIQIMVKVITVMAMDVFTYDCESLLTCTATWDTCQGPTNSSGAAMWLTFCGLQFVAYSVAMQGKEVSSTT